MNCAPTDRTRATPTLRFSPPESSCGKFDSLLFFKKGFSSLTGQYRTGSRVYDPAHYAELQKMFPAQASTGRVLFYKNQGIAVNESAPR